MSYCSWKNTFEVDVLTSKYSIHLRNLCQWGTSKIIIRKRLFPSGKPREKIKFFKSKDPTWKREHDYFFKMNEIDQKNTGSINSANKYGDCKKVELRNGVKDKIKKIFGIQEFINNNLIDLNIKKLVNRNVIKKVIK